MRIVDAVWEKRNLGVDCYEFHVETKDSLESVKESYRSIEERQYMVARVPSSRYDITAFFQEEGYNFIESAITLEHNLKEIKIPPRLARICSKCSWEKMNEADIAVLSSEIHKNIFKTDRIYIDPAFTEKQAAQRYDYWMKDLIREGNIPYKVLFAEESVGFFLNREMDRHIFDGLLAGTYSNYEGSGMGYCIQYAGIRFAADKGAAGYIGHVSGNNPAVLKVLLSIGFRVKEIEYIFIKHGKGEISYDRTGKN